MKSWWTSFTHWLNAVAIAVISLAAPAADMLPSLQAYVGPQFYKYAFITLAVVNMIVRQYKTSTALTPLLVSKNETPTQ